MNQQVHWIRRQGSLYSLTLFLCQKEILMSVLIMLQIECLCPVSSVENWIPKVMVLDGEFFGRRLDHEVWALMNGISEWTYKKGSLSIYIQRRQWHPTPVLLPGKSHGWRSLVGCSPWGREELDVTEQLRFHFSLSCIGEGNVNPLQYLYIAHIYSSLYI